MAKPHRPTSQTDALSTERIPALDGVRGLAIALVMLVHFSGMAVYPPQPTRWDLIVYRVAGAGWTGVDLFFVLSGFLITGILYDSKTAGGRGFFGNFYARRCLRIFPAYYAFLLLLFFLVPAVQSMETVANAAVADNRLWLISFLTNVQQAREAPTVALASHLWSVAVEEQFYLVWPVVIWLLSRRQAMIACVIAICGALALRVALVADTAHPWAPYTLMPARMDSLAVGALIALAMRHPADRLLLGKWLGVGAIVALAVVIGMAVEHGHLGLFDESSRTYGYTAIAIVFGGFIFASANVRPGHILDSALRFPGLTILGRYSYAMYLVHLPIGFLLSRRSGLGSSIPTVAGSHLPGVLTFSVCAFSLTLASAWLSWQILESQVLKLKVLFPYGRKIATTEFPRQDILSVPD